MLGTVSIHALVRVRLRDTILRMPLICFNPRTRESATLVLGELASGADVSIHALVRVRHGVKNGVKNGVKFQSTHS